MSNPVPAAEALAREGRLPSGEWPPTEKQVAYARALQTRLHLSGKLLDNHCVATYGYPFAGLGKQSMSKLIDELVRWKETIGLPDELRVAAGQRRLFGEGGGS